MDNVTSQKADKFVSDSKAANRGFDVTAWNVVKATIPADQQAEAEARAHAGLGQ